MLLSCQELFQNMKPHYIDRTYRETDHWYWIQRYFWYFYWSTDNFHLYWIYKDDIVSSILSFWHFGQINPNTTMVFFKLLKNCQVLLSALFMCLHQNIFLGLFADQWYLSSLPPIILTKRETTMLSGPQTFLFVWDNWPCSRYLI